MRTPRVLYGGAGTGGKSYGIRTATLELNGRLKELGWPGRWGAVFCETYKELAGRQMVKIKKEMGHLGKIKRTDEKQLHFAFNDPSLGGFYLRNVQDSDEYRGVEFDWVLPDELTTFTGEQFTDILYCLRSEDALPFLSFGSGSNPDGVGHDWVKGLWVNRDPVYFQEYDQDPRNFVFIQATVFDNPASNDAMIANLRAIKDPVKRDARLNGNWDLNLGARFSQAKRTIHGFTWRDFERFYGDKWSWQELINREDMFVKFASMDYGTADDSATAFYIHLVDWKHNFWTFGEEYLQGMFLRQQGEYLQKRPGWNYRKQPMYVDPSLTGRDSDGISRYNKFQKMGFRVLLGKNDREEGWATFDALLDYEFNGNVLERPPRWRIHLECVELWKFLTTAPRDEKKMEDVCRNFVRDHAGDGCRYGLHSYIRGRALPKTDESSVESQIKQLHSRMRRELNAKNNW